MPRIPPAAARYARVKQYLKEELERGRWPPGTQMPSEAALVQQFRVSRMTVNRALRELQAQGLVERVQGVGTFASHLGRVSARLTIRDLHDEIAARGHRHRAVVHLARSEPATAELAEHFGVKAGDAIFHTRIVHFEMDVPLQYEDRYVNPAFAPDYLQVDFTRTTPTHYLLQVAPVWEARYSVQAHAATAEEAALLGIRPGEPCLVVLRMTMNRGAPITMARLVHPGSRYQIEGRFKP